MNPMGFMKIKGLVERFKENHPKVPMFFTAASKSVDVDSIIEINITTAEGKSLCTNMKVTADDMELVRQLSETMKN
ncbi:MAG: hypothetical protein NC393_08480 [Clostridium sp.]|nr:hypothetical protein [Clostridium sp.]MCM1172146.1 hypothetical protein [Clostridium sp.]MCM1207716.1 hypothetical protein [Ruminococcus sp.]